MNAFIEQNTLIEQFLRDHQLSTGDLRNYCHQVGQEIAIIWHIDDIHQANKNLNQRALSNDEALLILSHVERDHDASQGISWNTIIWHIARYFETESL